MVLKRSLSVFLVLIMILGLSLPLQAATIVGSIYWQKALGGSESDSSSSIIPTSDGGYYIIGSSSSQGGDVSKFNGSSDAWIVRIDSTGNKVWDTSLGGSGDDYATAGALTAEGDLIVVGYYDSTDGDFPVKTGDENDTDLFVSKITSAGVAEWIHTYGSTGSDYGNDVIVARNGHIVIAADAGAGDGNVTGFYDSTQNTSDYWVLELDSTGSTIIWNDCYGGSGSDSTSSIIQTADGGYLVGGDTQSDDGDVVGYKQYGDAWLVKLTSTGSITWCKIYGGTGTQYGLGSGDSAQDMYENGDGSYIVAGSTDSIDGYLSDSHGSQDAWVFKVNSEGYLIWSVCLGGSQTDNAYGIIPTSDGGYFICGYTTSSDGDVTSNVAVSQYSSDIWVAKLKSDGSIEWQECLGGSQIDYASSVCQLADGSFTIAATTCSSDNDVTAAVGVSQYISDIWIVNFNGLAQVTGVTAKSAAYNKIKISWSAVNGALKYRVYRATSKSGTYSRVGEVTETTFTDSGLTTGKTYYYKVRAMNDSRSPVFYGAYCSVVSAAPKPAVPKNFAVTRVSNSQIKISYSAVTGATGYKIYRATSSGGTYSLVKTTTATSYTNGSLTNNKKYYYKVRSYRTVSGTSYYSSYTAVLSATP